MLCLGRDQATGKTQQKWTGGFRTTREAEEALTRALERDRTSTWADPGRQRVGEYLDAWLTSVSPQLAPTISSSG